MTRTGLVAHERYFWHDTGSASGMTAEGALLQPDRHPESPESKRRLLGLLEVSGLAERLVRIAPRPATLEELGYFHTSAYIERVRALSGGFGGDAGDQALVGPGSFEIALLSTGGCLAAADAVLGGKVRNAYALVRPPGHHAEPDRGRGYCLFGNAAILVHHARRRHRLQRVAVVDWDVHHGNGTELAFLDDPAVLTISLHQDRCFPVNAGQIEVIGRGAARGTNLNIPLPPGTGHGGYLAAFERAVLPALTRFRPELIVVASGLDANALDPLGRMMCTSETFRLMTRGLMGLADDLCGGRIVATHEGGYSNSYVPFCGQAVIEELSRAPQCIEDPFLAELMAMAGHELQAHQASVIDAAARLAKAVPAAA